MAGPWTIVPEACATIWPMRPRVTLDALGDLGLAGPGGRKRPGPCRAGHRPVRWMVSLSRIPPRSTRSRQQVHAAGGRVHRLRRRLGLLGLGARSSCPRSVACPAARGGSRTAVEISRRVLLPTPRSRSSRRMGTVSRSSTVSTLARSRALVARVPRPSSAIRVSKVAPASSLAKLRFIGVIGERARLFDSLEAVPPGRAASPRRCRTAR